MHVLSSHCSASCNRPGFDAHHSASCQWHKFASRSVRHRNSLKLNQQRPHKSRQHCLAGYERHNIVTPIASSEAADCLSRGMQKFNNGDRMGALKFFEQSLEKSPTLSQRHAALFNSTAVHASFGDIELAQITLREGVNRGLDFEGCLKSTDDPQLVRFQGSPQIVIQLRKFAEAVRRIKGAVGTADKPAAAPSGRPGAAAGGASEGGGYLGRDMSSMLRTEMTGIDPSLGGIFRRVAGLLVTGLVLGSVLFYVGLKLAFPSYN